MEYLTRKFQEKKSCLQDSPTAAGCLERQLPFHRSAILPGRAFFCAYFYSNTASTSFFCIRLFRLIDNIIRLPALHHFSVIQNQHLIAEALYKCKIWQINIKDKPCVSFSSSRSSMICFCMVTSRALVASSQIRTFGFTARALAIAAR